jgi:hypothetical protein
MCATSELNDQNQGVAIGAALAPAANLNPGTIPPDLAIH